MLEGKKSFSILTKMHDRLAQGTLGIDPQLFLLVEEQQLIVRSYFPLPVHSYIKIKSQILNLY